MLDTLLSYFAPHSCYECGQVGAALCEHCTNDIIDEPPVSCLLCTQPCSSALLCQSCRVSSGIDNAWYVGVREGGLQRAIDAFKFERVKAVAAHAAELMAGRLPQLPESIVVAYVPTSHAHIRTRGYDHIQLVAEAFARRRGLRCDALLRRNRATTQHFSSRKVRFENAKHAFEVIDASAEDVLLVDDIVTTGATICAAAAKLKESGVRHVYVAVILRQPSRRHAPPLVK